MEIVSDEVVGWRSSRYSCLKLMATKDQKSAQDIGNCKLNNFRFTSKVRYFGKICQNNSICFACKKIMCSVDYVLSCEFETQDVLNIAWSVPSYKKQLSVFYA